MSTDPKVIQIALQPTGEWTLGTDEDQVLGLSLQPEIYLGSLVEAEVSLSSTVKNLKALEQVVLTLRLVDSETDDEILLIKGTLSHDEENLSSFLRKCYTSGFFKNDGIDLTIDDDIEALEAIEKSTAYTPYNGFTKKKPSVLELPADDLPAFDEEITLKTLKSLTPIPSELGLSNFTGTQEEMELLRTILVVLQKLNIPLTIELAPTLNVDEVIDLANSLDLDNFQIQFIWSPNICRPFYANSALGKKVPHFALGSYFAHKAQRNSIKTAQNIPMIASPIAGEDFPFKATGLQKRNDIDFDEETLEKLAQAKINVIRPISYQSGTLFVLSDILTTKKSATSSLRLVNSAEIAMYTSRISGQILRNNLLRRKLDYMAKTEREIATFLTGCVTAKLLMPAPDLDYRPYAFSLVPDSDNPNERVKLTLQRGLETAVRSATFIESAERTA